MNLAYITDNLYGASMKVDCPIADLKILQHLFRKADVQQRLKIMGNMKNLQ
jgi:hypothetical protein